MESMKGLLQESKRWLTATLNSIGEAVLVTNNEGVITFLNPVAEHLTGWTQAEALGKEIIFLPSRETVRILALEAQGSHRRAETEEIFIDLTSEPFLLTKDGTAIPIEYNGAPVKDERGNVAGVVLVIQDISERKRVETALRQAKNAAETANRAKSLFLSSMGHELRTPLNAILGYAQLLQDAQNLSTEQREKLQVIGRSGEHLLMLINDILDVVNFESGLLELHIHEFELVSALRQIVDIVSVRAEQKDIRFHFLPGTALPLRIFADKQRLREVLLHLLGNAVKFTRQGHIALRITCQQRSDLAKVETLPFVCLRFEIEDSGIGIPEEKLRDIFVAFQQLDDKYHGVDGAGIGLTISRHILKLMGSELQVSSMVNTGSRFWFEMLVPAVFASDSFSPGLAATAAKTGADVSGGAGKIQRRAIPLESVRQLLALAHRGSPKKLLEELEQLEQFYEYRHPTLAELRRYARNYRIDACIDLLNKLMIL